MLKTKEFLLSVLVGLKIDTRLQCDVIELRSFE
jgi:hypothetical protein